MKEIDVAKLYQIAVINWQRMVIYPMFLPPHTWAVPFRPRSHCSVLWKRSKIYLFWPCVHISPLRKRSFSKTLMKMHKFENGEFWKRSVFSVNTKNRDIWARFKFLCWKAIEYNGIVVFKLTIGAFLTAANKRHCFEKGINNTVFLEQCERLSFS